VHNDLHPEARYDIMRMVYVMLPRFDKNWDDCQNAFEQLVFLFKNIDTLPGVPNGCMDKALEDILESARISKFSKSPKVGETKINATVAILILYIILQRFFWGWQSENLP